jgi:hypothetical protein
MSRSKTYGIHTSLSLDVFAAIDAPFGLLASFRNVLRPVLVRGSCRHHAATASYADRSDLVAGFRSGFGFHPDCYTRPFSNPKSDSEYRSKPRQE